jgi:hypothetical protein
MEDQKPVRSSQTLDLVDVVGGRPLQHHTLQLSETQSQVTQMRRQTQMTPRTRRKL